MNRAEIVKQIEKILWNHLNDDVAQVCELTDLFIELSNERCQEQRENCEIQYCRIETHRQKGEVTKAIRNAPLPEIS